MSERKILVVMELPDGRLLSCQLADLGISPQRGSCYTYENRLFEIERIIEPLGLRKDGTRKTTDEQLIELLTGLLGDVNAVVAKTTSMRNIGTADDGATKTAGGIIIGSSSQFAAQGDQLVYMQLKQVRVVSSAANLFRDLTAQAGQVSVTPGGSPSGDAEQ